MDKLEDVRNSLSAQASLLTELLTQATGPALQNRGLSLATFELLSAVKAAGEVVSQSEIARRLGITPPTLTEAVRIAKHRGLIGQDSGAPDRRRKTLRLTTLGEQTIQDVLTLVNQAEFAMVEGIDPNALATTIETMQKANMNLARALSKTKE